MNEICPDLEKYKDEWFRGFSRQEVMYGAALTAIILCLNVWSCFFAGLPMFVSIILSAWCATPVAVQGFYKIEGMTCIQVLNRYLALQDNTYYFVGLEEDGTV